MINHNVKRILINAGITVYLLATPVAVLIWLKNSYSILPEFLNQSIEKSIMFFSIPAILLISAIFFLTKNEYVIVTFVLYTILSTVKAMTSQIIVIDGMMSFFSFGGVIINICILIYMLKMSIAQKFKYRMNNSLKLKVLSRINSISAEVIRREFVNLLAISTGFLSVLVLGKISLLFITSSFPVIPDTIDTALLVLVLIMYIISGFLYITENKMRWVPYVIAVFIALIKTIHIFHYLQISMMFLPLLYLSVEWKQSGEKGVTAK